jgi:hypothetical protein
MGDVGVSLRNARKIQMEIPNGRGALINLQPGEEKFVLGDLDYFRSLPRMGIKGLVVKIAPPGKVRLVESNNKADVNLVRVKNNRKIQIMLATGLGRRAEVLEAGEEREFIARVSLIKQFSGISVKVLSQVAPSPDLTPEAPFVRGSMSAALRAARASTKAAAASPTSAPRSLAPPPVLPVAESLKHLEGTKDQLREQLQLPGSREEWLEKSKVFSWVDLRAVAQQLGVTGRGREKIIAVIGDAVYE